MTEEEKTEAPKTDKETEELRRDLVTKEIQHVLSMEVDLAPPDIKVDAWLVEDLGMDSLAMVETILALEDKYDIDIEDEEIEKVRTVQDVIDYIFKRVYG